MGTLSAMKPSRAVPPLLVVLACLALTAQAYHTSFYVKMTGKQQVPKVPSKAIAEAYLDFGRLSDSQPFLFYSRTQKIKNMTMMHIHGPVDNPKTQSAGVVLGLIPKLTGQLSPPVTTTKKGKKRYFFRNANFTLTDIASSSVFAGKTPQQAYQQLFDWAKAGKLYLNVHTTAYPAGELRGTLECQETTSCASLPV